MPNLALGSGDSLTDRRFGLQQRPGDLGHREPRDQSQGERELRSPVQCRVRAGEHHPQFVIADLVRDAPAFGAGTDVVDHGSEFLSRPDGFTAQTVQRAVARDRHDPPAGVVRHTVAGPRP